MERKRPPAIRTLVGVCLALLLCGAAAAWVASAAPAPRVAMPAAAATPPPPPPPLPTPTIPPTPTDLPTAHPAFGLNTAAEGWEHPGSENYDLFILNHASFNLSDPRDCEGGMCPLPALDRMGLNRDNTGTQAIYELNRFNDFQQLADNWIWYWLQTTEEERDLDLWPSAPQYEDEGVYIPVFTPGYIMVKYAAWHTDGDLEHHWPSIDGCTDEGDFLVDPAHPDLIAAYAPPPNKGTVSPTDWKYWICAGPNLNNWGFDELYAESLFRPWVQANQGKRYAVGNEEHFYMLPEAYAAMFQLMYDKIHREFEDTTATFYLAAMASRFLTPACIPLVNFPLVTTGWEDPGGQEPLSPPPPDAYPPPYPLPEGGSAAALPPLPPDPYPLVPTGGEPLQAGGQEPGQGAVLAGTLTSDHLEKKYTQLWLAQALDFYEDNYCPDSCVDGKVPASGFLVHAYVPRPHDDWEDPMDTCAEAADVFTAWVDRVQNSALYFSQFADRVLEPTLYIKETGLMAAAFISSDDAWDVDGPECKEDSPLFEACVANVDISNRVSSYILKLITGEIEPAAGVKVEITGASWLSPYYYPWYAVDTIQLDGLDMPYMSRSLTPLDRGMVCGGYVANCPSRTNHPTLHWAISPNAYGYFLGACGDETNFCLDNGFTPVELQDTLPPDLPNDLDEWFPRSYGPVWWRPDEQDPPSSAVDALDTWQCTVAFTVSWSGSDESGVDEYDVQYRPEGGAWTGWVTGTEASDAVFAGQDGQGYEFRCRARDNAGNEESWPTDADASTTVDATPPESAADSPQCINTSPISVSWSAEDATSGVASTTLFYSYEGKYKQKPWISTGLSQGGTAGVFSFWPSEGEGLYRFATKSTDQAGNLEEKDLPSGGGGDTETIFDTTRPSSSVDTLPTYSPPTFVVSWSGFDAASGIKYYDVQYRDAGGGDWVWWVWHKTFTSKTFTGEVAHTYEFRCRAWDNAGNRERWPSTPDASTTIGKAPPNVDIQEPRVSSYGLNSGFTLTFTATDAISGVESLTATLDGEPAQNRDTVDCLWLAPGRHTLAVTVTNRAGFTNSIRRPFTVTVDLTAVISAGHRLRTAGHIYGPAAPAILNSLDATLRATRVVLGLGRPQAAVGLLRIFIHVVQDRTGQHISPEAGQVLTRAAEFVIARLERGS